MTNADPARSPTIEDVLGPLGASVMRVVWRQGEATVASVADTLTKETGHASAYTTVMTIMGRLSDRGLLAREKRGRVYVYHAVADERALIDRLGAEALDRLIARFGATAYRHFALRLADVDPELRQRLLDLAAGGEHP